MHFKFFYSPISNSFCFAKLSSFRSSFPLPLTTLFPSCCFLSFCLFCLFVFVCSVLLCVCVCVLLLLFLFDFCCIAFVSFFRGWVGKKTPKQTK